MYSSIKTKTCKCGCGKMPTLGYNGYKYSCAPAELIEKVGNKRKVAERNKNARLTLGRKLNDLQRVVSGAEMNRWFEEMRKEMTGVCANCGGKSCRDNDDYFKFSIAHILPKAYFQSVKIHPVNWIELCYFGNGCHPQMDNKLLDLIDMACFDTIVTRFVQMYPSIAIEERRRIPAILLEYLKTET